MGSVKYKSQLHCVASTLLETGLISPNLAQARCGTTRLGARIFELREMGVQITTEHMTFKNKLGNPGRVAWYYLVQNKQNIKRLKAILKQYE